MESNIKNVSLSFCCKEDWQSFPTIDERTRFCGSCKHKVIDFTNADQVALQQAFQSGHRVCGRFKSSQMNQSFLKLAAASLIVAASTSVISCAPEHMDPQPGVPPLPKMEDFELMGDIAFTGMVIEVIDSTEVKIDRADSIR